MESVAQERARKRRTVRDELADRYRELKEREAAVSFDTDVFYMDVAKLLGQFSADSLANRLGVTRDAVYQWARKGRIAKERYQNGNPETDKQQRR